MSSKHVAKKLHDSIKAKDVDSVKIDIIGGNLFLEPNKSDSLDLEIQSDTDLKAEFVCKGRVATLRIRAIKAFVTQKEKYTYTLKMPADLPLHVRMVGGLVSLHSMAGPLDISIMAGEITGTAPTRQARLRVGTGNIELSKLLGNVDAKVAVGDLKLNFDEVTKDSVIYARLGCGDMKLGFPQGVAPHKKMKKNGPIKNALGADINAAVFLGDLKI